LCTPAPEWASSSLPELNAEFGRIAVALGEREPETEFQVGLRRFSVLLLQVAVVLTTLILVTNLALHRSLIESLLFSLAIAVGVTPQLLPAVSTALAEGSSRLARQKVLVKRLVCIEDLGDIDILVTDKTGTLTDGRISFVESLDPVGGPAPDVLLYGLLSTESGTAGADHLGTNPVDAALWKQPDPPATSRTTTPVWPSDHTRRMSSTLVRSPTGTRMIVVKGALESVLDQVLPSTYAGFATAVSDSGSVQSLSTARNPSASETVIAARSGTASASASIPTQQWEV
jgi:Mg2+-importing ATPase